MNIGKGILGGILTDVHQGVGSILNGIFGHGNKHGNNAGQVGVGVNVGHNNQHQGGGGSSSQVHVGGGGLVDVNVNKGQNGGKDVSVKVPIFGVDVNVHKPGYYPGYGNNGGGHQTSVGGSVNVVPQPNNPGYGQGICAFYQGYIMLNSTVEPQIS